MNRVTLLLRPMARALPAVPVLYATILLFAVCLLVAPHSVGGASLNAMLPFAAVLAIAGVGQTLVVQQRGVDLSVAGTVTLSAVMISKLPAGDGDLVWAVAACLAAGAAIGAVVGLLVTFLKVTPLIATFGMNAVIGGAVLAYSGGVTHRVPPALSTFSVGRTLGVLNMVWLAVALVLLAALIMASTRFGRGFVAVGSNIDAARASGLRVGLIRWSAYVGASLCYAVAGIVLAGYVNVPNLQVGDSYVMPSIAAVVLGGTLLSGGRGRMVGTLIAAVLLSQLNQFVLSVGAPSAMQLIVQGAVIAVAAVFQTTRGRAIANAVRRRLIPTQAKAVSA
jgi:ribose transport system permease protein